MSPAERLDAALLAIATRGFKADTIVLHAAQIRALGIGAPPGFVSGVVDRWKGVAVLACDLVEDPHIDAHSLNVPGKVRTFKLVSQASDT